ncbi:nitronate monooxygenase [Paenibacillus brasilensis]|uniref:Probable nitronate monooxygenase n=1 Tax=Paenibacillus brasilensis TaxID=128574 RepID=A0ABU0L2W4_9BACL|nr:nitronate monooxygenase [Paenibacillus brasilensis]MDQ0495341.1 enoyl-[acyl-carrier protein] reductase II [Paenibacillus brasilensis]
MSNNRLCKVLGIEKPIIQGPMAWVSTVPLVAAVSESGGLGVLGVGFAPLDFIRDQIIATRNMMNKPFAINVIMTSELLDHVTKVASEEKPPVIYADTLVGLDLELSQKYFSIWHELGIKVIVKASTIQDAITAEKAGADAVIVKGWEGGGHTTYEATTVLVPQAANCLSVPVIASGGIADGRGMAAAIALGADGIEMGTIFMCAEETVVHANVKDAMLKAGDMETVITGYSTDEPCRQLKNKLSEEMTEIENKYSKREAAVKLKEVAESSLKKAMLEGDVEEKGAVMVGQIVPLITEIKSVKDIINDVLEGYHETISKITKFEV